MPVWMPCSHVSNGDVADLVLAFVGVEVSMSLPVAVAGVSTSASVGDVVVRSSSVAGPLTSVGVVACSSAGGVAIRPSVGVVVV